MDCRNRQQTAVQSLKHMCLNIQIILCQTPSPSPRSKDIWRRNPIGSAGTQRRPRGSGSCVFGIRLRSRTHVSRWKRETTWQTCTSRSSLQYWDVERERRGLMMIPRSHWFWIRRMSQRVNWWYDFLHALSMDWLLILQSCSYSARECGIGVFLDELE